MNAEQRKFLINKITESYNQKKNALEESLPEEPKLNNYLIGAFLDNSVKILDSKVIKMNLKKYVESLGSKSLVEDEYIHSWRRKRDVDTEVIKIEPELIMELPKTYIDARKKWNKKKEEVDKAVKELTVQKDTLVLKIQIGSNAILDKLILQVDSLGDLNLFSDKLSMIAEGIFDPTKQIENDK